MSTALLLSETALNGRLRICVSGDFPRDTVHKKTATGAPRIGQNRLVVQGLKVDQTDASSDTSTYIVHVRVELDPTFPAETPGLRRRKGRKIGRPKKRGRKRTDKPDGRRRKSSGPLSAADRRDVLDAVHFASHLGQPLDTTIDIHPAFLDTYPAGELRDWMTKGPWRTTGQWLERRGVRWVAIATAENYVGERRQHYHVVCRCPPKHRAALWAMLRKSFPGDARAFRVGVLLADGLTYRVKQSSGNAVGPPRPGRPRPETHSRHDGAAVAPVMGKRTFISRSLAHKARTKSGWQAAREEERALAKVMRLQAQART